jgi:hypothetical protein
MKDAELAGGGPQWDTQYRAPIEKKKKTKKDGLWLEFGLELLLNLSYES